MTKHNLHHRDESLEFTALNGSRVLIPIKQVAGIMPSAMRPARSLVFDHRGRTWRARENHEDLQLSLTILYHMSTTFTPFEA